MVTRREQVAALRRRARHLGMYLHQSKIDGSFLIVGAVWEHPLSRLLHRRSHH